jgi:ATP-dependent Clp protease ATP-binding subunit ClpA
MWQLLLGMLDKATLTLGDNRKVDLSRTMIFLTGSAALFCTYDFGTTNRSKT